MICSSWSLWVSLSWLGILFPVIFTYVHPQGQVTVTVATFVVYTKRHHVPEKFSQRWLRGITMCLRGTKHNPGYSWAAPWAGTPL